MLSLSPLKSVAFRQSARNFTKWTFPTAVDAKTPVFIVTPKNGFLPRNDPISSLPPKYKVLDDLLNEMSLTLENGKPGLLARGTA